MAEAASAQFAHEALVVPGATFSTFSELCFAMETIVLPIAGTRRQGCRPLIASTKCQQARKTRAQSLKLSL